MYESSIFHGGKVYKRLYSKKEYTMCKII